MMFGVRSRVLMVECQGGTLMEASFKVGPLGMVYGIYSHIDPYIMARNQTFGIPNIRVMMYDPSRPLPFEEGLISSVISKDGTSPSIEEPVVPGEAVTA